MGLSNATAGGSDEQVRYLVDHGAIPALCDLLTCAEAKIVMVVLEALENMLRLDKKLSGSRGSDVKTQIEECNGLDALEQLQRHENEEVYGKVVKMLSTYFEGEEDVAATVAALAPTAVGFGRSSRFAFKEPTVPLTSLSSLSSAATPTAAPAVYSF